MSHIFCGSGIRLALARCLALKISYLVSNLRIKFIEHKNGLFKSIAGYLSHSAGNGRSTACRDGRGFEKTLIKKTCLFIFVFLVLSLQHRSF